MLWAALAGASPAIEQVEKLHASLRSAPASQSDAIDEGFWTQGVPLKPAWKADPAYWRDRLMPACRPAGARQLVDRVLLREACTTQVVTYTYALQQDEGFALADIEVERPRKPNARGGPPWALIEAEGAPQNMLVAPNGTLYEVITEDPIPASVDGSGPADAKAIDACRPTETGWRPSGSMGSWPTLRGPGGRQGIVMWRSEPSRCVFALATVDRPRWAGEPADHLSGWPAPEANLFYAERLAGDATWLMDHDPAGAAWLARQALEAGATRTPALEAMAALGTTVKLAPGIWASKDVHPDGLRFPVRNHKTVPSGHLWAVGADGVIVGVSRTPWYPQAAPPGLVMEAPQPSSLLFGTSFGDIRHDLPVGVAARAYAAYAERLGTVEVQPSKGSIYILVDGKETFEVHSRGAKTPPAPEPPPAPWCEEARAALLPSLPSLVVTQAGPASCAFESDEGRFSIGLTAGKSALNGPSGPVPYQERRAIHMAFATNGHWYVLHTPDGVEAEPLAQTLYESFDAEASP